MPRSMVKNIPEEQNAIIRGSIKNLLEIRRMTVPEVAKKIGMKRSTLYSRIRNPDTFNIKELRMVYKALCVPDEEKERIAREAM